MRLAASAILVLAVVLAPWHSLRAQAGPAFPTGEVDRVRKAQEEAHRRYVAALDDRSTEVEQTRATERYLAEVARNTDAVLALARSHPKDPAVVPALQFVITTSGRGPGTQSYQAMEILLRDHARDPGIGEVCGRIFHFSHSGVAEALLRAVLKDHPSRADRGYACQSLAWLLESRAVMVRSIRSGKDTVDRYVSEAVREPTERLVERSDPDALDREAEQLRERSVAEFADVPDWFMPGRTLGDVARGELFFTRKLSVGQVAPEITGQDIDGKTFSLSEFRGKVVVLTFSASWCGPCVAMYPDNRALIQKLEGKPFALVSVHSDEDPTKLREKHRSGEITWRCWWDAGTYGPITTGWGISAIPEVFVLDREGVIRNRNLRGKELEAAVQKLLDPAGSPPRR